MIVSNIFDVIVVLWGMEYKKCIFYWYYKILRGRIYLNRNIYW